MQCPTIRSLAVHHEAQSQPHVDTQLAFIHGHMPWFREAGLAPNPGSIVMVSAITACSPPILFVVHLWGEVVQSSMGPHCICRHTLPIASRTTLFGAAGGCWTGGSPSSDTLGETADLDAAGLELDLELEELLQCG